MLALGIDPGTAICGYGLVEMRGNRLKAIDFGAIETSAHLSPPERLEIIFEGINNLIDRFQPTLMGVEQLFFNRNVTTAISVGQARGVILLAGSQHKIELREFTPLQVKQAVVGYGKATKQQVIYMTQHILNIPYPPKPDDAADALAIAICSLHASNLNKVWGRTV
jgi:crossover junction endodeoxyribonuclease RuvC